jgi:probable phosphomutase (TIGR03848 family)
MFFMTNILLVRHGETEWVHKNRLAGRIPDIHLNGKGRRQADAVAERLAHLPIKAVYSSPIMRCWQTAVPIAQAHQLQICELRAMIEVEYGQWQGRKIKELAKEKSWHSVQHFPSRFRFPEGESMLAVQFRAVNALEELAQRHPQELIVVVSHADVIKLVLAHYLGVHVDLFQRVAISPASVTALGLTADGQVRILRVNDDGPIEAPKAEENRKGKKSNATTDAAAAVAAGGLAETTAEKEEL